MAASHAAVLSVRTAVDVRLWKKNLLRDILIEESLRLKCLELQDSEESCCG